MSNELALGKNSMLSPTNFEHYFRIANMMSKSQMVPKAYQDKPQDVLIAMEMGASLGLGPLQAIQNIAVINGKPCLYGDGILAVCSGRPDFENITENKILDDKGKTIGYICIVNRKGRSPVEQSFTLEQANHAGLLTKNPVWKTYPERMLQMRARAFALRDCFADALMGIGIAEEIADYEIKDITPKPAAAATQNRLSDLIANKSNNSQSANVAIEAEEVKEGG